MTVSSNGTPAIVASAATLTPSATGTFPTGSSPLANHLMLAVVGGYSTTTAPIPAAPAGWTLWNSVTGQTAASGASSATTFVAYYVKTATGSDSAPVFTSTFTGTAADASLTVVVYDLSDSSGQTPILFTDGIGNLPVAGPVVLFTAGPAPAGSLGIVSQKISQGTTSATTTWTAPTTGSWNACTTNQTTTGQSQFATFWTSAAPATGATMSASITHSRTATQCPTIAIVVAPPGSSGVRAFQATYYQAPTTSASALTSPSFTPQTGDLIVAASSVGNGAGTAAATALTYTDNGGSGAASWVPLVTELGSSASGAAAIACKQVGTPGSTTVTFTITPSSGVQDPTLVVYRMANAALAGSQNGGTKAALALTVAVIPVSTGGVIVGASGAQDTTARTAASGTNIYPSTSGGAGDRIINFNSTTVTTATVSQTVGVAGGTAADTGTVAAEIVPAPSGPAAVPNQAQQSAAWNYAHHQQQDAGFQLPTPVPYTEQAAASDTLSVAVAATLADQAAASDVLAGPGVALADADQAAAGEAFTVAVALAVAEQAGAADTLIVAKTDEQSQQSLAWLRANRQQQDAGFQAAGPHAVTYADQAAANEAVTVAVAVTLADQSAAGDVLSAAAGVVLADQAAAADVVAVAAAVPLTEQAAAGDVLAVAVAEASADQAGAADSFIVSTAVEQPQQSAAWNYRNRQQQDAGARTVALFNNAEGIPALATITPANSGGISGAAFDNVTIGSGATATADNTDSAHGAQCLLFTTGGTSATAFVQWQAASVGEQVTRLWFRAYVKISAYPSTANNALLRFEHNGTNVGQLYLLTTGQLNFDTPAFVPMVTTTVAMPLNTWVRVEGWLQPSATNGQAALQTYYSGLDSVTPTESLTSAAGQALGASVNNIVWGITANEASWSVRLDDIGISNTGPIGPVTYPLPEQAAVSDVLLPAAAVPVAEQAAASDTLAVAVAVTVADQAAASDVVAPAVAVGLAEQAAAADTETVFTAAIEQPQQSTRWLAAHRQQQDAGASAGAPIPVTYTEQAAAGDVLAVAVSAALAEQAAAGEGVAVTAAVALADQAAAAEAAVVAASVVLADQAAAGEVLAVSVALGLAEAAAAADTVLSGVPVTYAEQAAASEAFQAAVSAQLADAAAVGDVLGTTAVLGLSEAAVAAEAFTVVNTTGMTGVVAYLARRWLPRWTADPCQPRWGPGPWLPRWTLSPQPPQWEAAGIHAQWGASLVNFSPIAALSLEYVNVAWTAELAGTLIDPTGQTAGQSQLAVQFAFPLSSGNPLAPAEPVTWYSGVWLQGQTSAAYIAQCLTGPTGVVQLTAGSRYDVWGKITGAPEIPVKFAGTLPVY